jgi:hypothetical protein
MGKPNGSDQKPASGNYHDCVERCSNSAGDEWMIEWKRLWFSHHFEMSSEIVVKSTGRWCVEGLKEGATVMLRPGPCLPLADQLRKARSSCIIHKLYHTRDRNESISCVKYVQGIFCRLYGLFASNSLGFRPGGYVVHDYPQYPTINSKEHKTSIPQPRNECLLT